MPSAEFPRVPLVETFRRLPTGRHAQQERLAHLATLLADPALLARRFAESVEAIEQQFNCLQPFYPSAHTFGSKPDGTPHGERLTATVDVARRLSERSPWVVEGDDRLDFAYLDRELELARANPRTPYPRNSGANLVLDLFLVNTNDRTPILCELKIGTDQDGYYALLQLLCLAAYAVTASQRARLVLWGSRPDRVLTEEISRKPIPPTDLYLLALQPPTTRLYPKITEGARKLSEQLLRQPELAAYIRRIAWLRADEDNGTLRISSEAVYQRPRATSRIRHHQEHPEAVRMPPASARPDDIVIDPDFTGALDDTLLAVNDRLIERADDVHNLVPAPLRVARMASQLGRAASLLDAPPASRSSSRHSDQEPAWLGARDSLLDLSAQAIEACEAFAIPAAPGTQPSTISHTVLLPLSYWAIRELFDEGLELEPDQRDWIAPILAEFASLAAAVSRMTKAAKGDTNSVSTIERDARSRPDPTVSPLSWSMSQAGVQGMRLAALCMIAATSIAVRT